MDFVTTVLSKTAKGIALKDDCCITKKDEILRIKNRILENAEMGYGYVYIFHNNKEETLQALEYIVKTYNIFTISYNEEKPYCKISWTESFLNTCPPIAHIYRTLKEDGIVISSKAIDDFVYIVTNIAFNIDYSNKLSTIFSYTYGGSDYGQSLIMRYFPKNTTNSYILELKTCTFDELTYYSLSVKHNKNILQVNSCNTYHIITKFNELYIKYIILEEKGKEK